MSNSWCSSGVQQMHDLRKVFAGGHQPSITVALILSAHLPRVLDFFSLFRAFLTQITHILNEGKPEARSGNGGIE